MSIRTATALAVALCSLPLLALAQGGGGSDAFAYKASDAAAKPLPAHGPTTVEEMEAFVDGFMSSQMKAGPVAGAAVIVVKDGLKIGENIIGIGATLVRDGAPVQIVP